MSKNISFISSSDYSKITFIGPVWKFSFSHSLCELYEHFEFSILFSMWLQTYAVLQKDNTRISWAICKSWSYITSVFYGYKP